MKIVRLPLQKKIADCEHWTFRIIPTARTHNVGPIHAGSVVPLL